MRRILLLLWLYFLFFSYRLVKLNLWEFKEQWGRFLVLATVLARLLDLIGSAALLNLYWLDIEDELFPLFSFLSLFSHLPDKHPLFIIRLFRYIGKIPSKTFRLVLVKLRRRDKLPLSFYLRREFCYSTLKQEYLTVWVVGKFVS